MLISNKGTCTENDGNALKQVVCSLAWVIIYSVSSFFKTHYLSEEVRQILDFSKYRSLTIQAHGVHKSIVSHIAQFQHCSSISSFWTWIPKFR